MRIARALLVIIAVVCLGVALSYPLRYREAQEKNDSDMEELARMRQQARQSQSLDLPDSFTEQGRSGAESEADAGQGTEGGRESVPGAESTPANVGDEGGDEPVGSPADTGAASSSGAAEGNASDGEPGQVESPAEAVDGPEGVPQRPTGTGSGNSADAPEVPALPTPEPTPTPKPTPTPEPTRQPNYWDLSNYLDVTPTPTPKPEKAVEGPTVEPTPTPDRSIRKGPLPYALKDKVALDKSAILPELKDIYALNNDLVGWINIPDTVVDYPVVQAEDGEYYLTHDFYGEENINGQIILDVLCDPYTPSYNLVVSGHHMKNGTMFGSLPEYRNKSHWEKHRFLEFDTLMERKLYVIFACFYSADYDEDETGFRYNAIIDYKIDADRWLAEIEANQLYDTGIEREFGDEFITLTTCDRARHRNGRFVVVGRKIREGEKFE